MVATPTPQHIEPEELKYLSVVPTAVQSSIEWSSWGYSVAKSLVPGFVKVGVIYRSHIFRFWLVAVSFACTTVPLACLACLIVWFISNLLYITRCMGCACELEKRKEGKKLILVGILSCALSLPSPPSPFHLSASFHLFFTHFSFFFFTAHR